MPSPLLSTWSADGIALTATRVDLNLKGKDLPLSFSPTEQADLPPFLLDDRFTCLEDVHAHLRASGGRLLGAQTKKTTDECPPLEIWVWDTTLFMEVRYQPEKGDSHAVFRLSGIVHAFVNEGWHAGDVIEHKGLWVYHITQTTKGHSLVYYKDSLTTLPDLLSCVARIRRFSDPVSVDDLLNLESPPSFSNETLDTYFESRLPHGTQWSALKKRPHLLSAAMEIKKYCTQDDMVRQHILSLPEELLCESRRLYEQWFLWINGKRLDVPPCMPDPALGPMVALPSLLTVACAEGSVHTQVERLLLCVLDQMTPEEMRRWWCTPDALGKTGAQWFFSGLLGNGALLTEKRPEIRKTRNVPPLVSDRVQWGKDLLQKIEGVIGPQERAWFSDQWTPTGLCVEVIGATTTLSEIVPHAFKCLELLPETVWLHPLRCLTRQPFLQQMTQTQTERFQNTTLDVSLVQCALSFTLDAPPLSFMKLSMPRTSGGNGTGAWKQVLTDLSFPKPHEDTTCDGPFLHFRDGQEQYNALTQFLEQGARLHARASLAQTLTFSQKQACQGRPRRRV